MGMGRHNALVRKGSSWYNWVHNRLTACFNKDVVDKCVAWMDSEQAMPTNPGILAANKRTMLKYLDKMMQLLTTTNEFGTQNEQNCMRRCWCRLSSFVMRKRNAIRLMIQY